MTDIDNTANSGTTTPEAGGRLFTQEQVNAIVQDRLAKERAKYGNQKNTNPEINEKDAEAEVSEVDKIKAEFEALRQQVEAEKQSAKEAKEKADAEAALQRREVDQRLHERRRLQAVCGGHHGP